MSNEEPDSYGDIVVQAGLDFSPALPAVADHSHHLQAAIGDWHSIERGNRETFATLRLLPRGVSRAADLVRALHDGGYPLASSIYFEIAPADIEQITRTGADGRAVPTKGKRYRRGKVTEITLTQFPANASAVAVARSLGINDAELDALLRPEPALVSNSRTSSAVAGADAHRGTTIMTVTEQIAAAQTAHDAAQAALATATLALESDQSEANRVAFARSATEANTQFEWLSVLRSAQTAAARQAAAAPAPAPAAATSVSRAVAALANDNRSAAHNTRRTDTKDVKPGTRLAQLVIARSVAFESRRPLDQVASEMFAQEPEVIAIARSLVGVADTTTAGWAAELVRTETRAMLQVDLLPYSAWASLSAQGVTIGFNGANTVVIPQMDVGTSVDGAWVGEGGAIPVVKGNIGAKRLSRYKIGGIVPITNELQRTSDPQAVDVMRVFLRQVLSNLLDSSLITNTAEVPGVRPAGLLFGVTPIAGHAGGGEAAVDADIQALMAAFIAANVRGRKALIMSEMAVARLSMMKNALGQLTYPSVAATGGTIGVFTIIPSPFIVDTLVIAVSVDNFASAFDPMEVDVNEAATLQMANADATAPTHAGAGALGGALGTAHQVPVDGGIPISGGNGASIAGSVAVSMWQTWSLALRMVMPASFGLTKAGAVQAVTGITW